METSERTKQRGILQFACISLKKLKTWIYFFLILHFFRLCISKKFISPPKMLALINIRLMIETRCFRTSSLICPQSHSPSNLYYLRVNEGGFKVDGMAGLVPTSTTTPIQLQLPSNTDLRRSQTRTEFPAAAYSTVPLGLSAIWLIWFSPAGMATVRLVLDEHTSPTLT